MRVMGLAWTNASRELLQEAAGDVIAQQQAGGDWSQHEPTLTGTSARARIRAISEVRRRPIAQSCLYDTRCRSRASLPPNPSRAR